MELPVVDGEGPFVWDVWVSLSEANFKRASDRWHDPNRTEEPPYFGWLCNSLPGYPETLSLKTNAHTRGVGIRPFIELEPTDHPLAVEQRDGITMVRVLEIAETAMHHNAALPADKFRGLKRILGRVLRQLADPTAMRLQSIDGATTFDLEIVRYQFPELENDEWDSNWLLFVILHISHCAESTECGSTGDVRGREDC